MTYISLTKQNIDSEHICCAFSDKKCVKSYELKKKAENPYFNSSVLNGECPDKDGFIVYYSNRCPYSEYHVENSLSKTIKNIKLFLSGP